MRKIYIGHSEIAGRGIFANTEFVRNETLFTVQGEIRHDSYGPNYSVGSRWFGIDDRIWLALPTKSYANYLNHSCNPTCGVKDQVVIVAMRRIQKGEEITLDYSTTEADPFWKMRCRCGKQDCRKIIRSIQFLPEEIYRNYEPLVPEFVRRARVRMKDSMPE